MPDEPAAGADPAAVARLESAATTALILGILGMTICGICAPFALFKGLNVNKELKAAGRPADTKATIGFVLGLIGSIFMVIGLIAVLAMVVFGVAAGASAPMPQ